MQTATVNAYEIAQQTADAIHAAHSKWLTDKSYSGRWKSNRASGLDDVCTRRIYLYRTAGELVPPPDPDLQAVFTEGQIQEPSVRRHLSELGFEIKKAGYAADWYALQISGEIDGIISKNGIDLVAEVKTVSDTAWRSLKTAEDLMNDRGWYRKWYGQMQIYLLLLEKSAGLFVLKRKQAFQLRIIPIALDYGYAESLLKKAEAVNAAMDNAAECAKCPFFQRVCNPPINMGEGLRVVQDAQLEEDFKRMATLEEASAEYKEIETRVKERFKAGGKGTYQAGSWVVSVIERPVRRLDSKTLPQDIKDQYTKINIDRIVQWEKVA